MWHSLGAPRPARFRPSMERFVEEQRARQANDNDADARAMRFAESLEEAILDHDTGEAGFERATRKADHVEELHRILGILLDILADWELSVERAG